MRITEETKEKIYELYRSKYKLSEIAKLFGVSQTTIVQVARKGIKEGRLEPRNPLTFGKTPQKTGKGKYVKKGTRHKKLTDEQEQELMVDYFENGYSVKMIKEKYHIWEATFHRIRKNAVDRGQYQSKGRGRGTKYNLTKEQEQEIVVEYFEKGITREQLAKKYNVPASKIVTISSEARKRGLYTKKKVIPEDIKKAIVEDYFVNNMTAEQVADKYNVKKRRVQSIAEKERKKGDYEHKKGFNKMTPEQKEKIAKAKIEFAKKRKQQKLDEYQDLFVDYFENGLNRQQIQSKYKIKTAQEVENLIVWATRHTSYKRREGRGWTNIDKLDESKVSEILADYFEKGVQVLIITKKYNISVTSVYKLINRAIAEGKYDKYRTARGGKKDAESLKGTESAQVESLDDKKEVESFKETKS